MKIIRTDTDLSEQKLIKNEKEGIYQLILMKSPAEAVIADEKKTLGVNSAIVLGNKSMMLRTAEDADRLQYDCIAFAMNNTFGSQLIESMGIPVDVPFEIIDDTVIRSIIGCICIQEFSDESRKNEFYEAAVRMLLIAVSEQINSGMKMPSSGIPYSKALYALRNSIYANPLKDRSIEEICQQLNISTTYFHRIYFSAFGTTCRQDIINSRLILAEKLLVDTDRTIGSIAEECGYDNDSYFMRQFKKQRGVTPTEFRRKFAKNTLNDEV